MTTHPRAALIACLVLAAACGRPSAGSVHRDTLTQRQRDSAVGASALPGAGGVRRALAAQDSANRRTAQLDSIGAEH